MVLSGRTDRPDRDKIIFWFDRLLASCCGSLRPFSFSLIWFSGQGSSIMSLTIQYQGFDTKLKRGILETTSESKWLPFLDRAGITCTYTYKHILQILHVRTSIVLIHLHIYVGRGLYRSSKICVRIFPLYPEPCQSVNLTLHVVYVGRPTYVVYDCS